MTATTPQSWADLPPRQKLILLIRDSALTGEDNGEQIEEVLQEMLQFDPNDPKIQEIPLYHQEIIIQLYTNAVHWIIEEIVK